MLNFSIEKREKQRTSLSSADGIAVTDAAEAKIRAAAERHFNKFILQIGIGYCDVWDCFKVIGSVLGTIGLIYFPATMHSLV